MLNVKATSAFLHGLCVVAVEFMNVHSIVMYTTDSSEGHGGSTLNGFQRLYQERMLISFPSPLRTPLKAEIYPSEEVAFLYPVVPYSAENCPLK